MRTNGSNGNVSLPKSPKRLKPGVSGGAPDRDAELRGILEVLEAVKRGDFTARVEVVGTSGTTKRIAREVNELIDRLQSVGSEIIRVAREVGTDGKLGAQAEVRGVSGTWKDLTDNVNGLATNLTDQVRNIALVTTAVANGDLSQKITVEARGEILELKLTINRMVDQLRAFASEVTRVAREVGTEGKLGAVAEVQGVAGTWKDLTHNVNVLASNLTNQVRNIALVTTAVANGDLSQKITVEARGEIFELKETINRMVDQLRSFASEVTRVAREVGTDGKLGGQAQVAGVSGTWKDLTDNVNVLASNLTNQVRNIALVTTAVANGDLSKQITVEARGEILELKDTINRMVEQLRSFASEVTRVAREVGTDGKLGGQATVPGVAGTWKDLTDNVNQLASNLTNQVRNIALVTTAVAQGDFSQKIGVEARGEILELKETINRMVDQLRTFTVEVTRVAREVGTDGKLGGQATVPGVAGTWKDLTDNVNQLAGSLTNQVRNIALVTKAIQAGDLSQKITVEARGEILELKETINRMVDQLRAFAAEVTRVAREVGTDGKLGGQALVPDVAGTWKDLTDNVNQLAGNLTNQVRAIALVTKAIERGDLSQKITVEASGEILELKETINRMVDQLRAFAAEVTRVAREVGTDGKLGGQAQVPGVSGTWKDLTENVNVMASNLTLQVRGIAKVVTAVAQGDLSPKLALGAKGEIASLAETINDMTNTLHLFAEQVTTVAREVGIEGKLGGQAKVPGAAGTWRALTDAVNQLASNLTTQVRAIAEVATAVTAGDLTRAISVEAKGEVLQLKDSINKMIANLRDTTRANKEQDWLKTNLAKFSGMMQGQRSIAALARLVMSELTPLVSAQQGLLYVLENEEDTPMLQLLSSYAFESRKQLSNLFALGEGLVGQCALEKKSIIVTDIPGDYLSIRSGLGKSPPANVIVLPVLFEGQLKAVIELASFQEFTPIHITFLDQLVGSIGVVFNMIGASMRTEELLQELQRSNSELGNRSRELEEKASELEIKNREIARASTSLEEKARELARASKYKSDFLANMSHELRTPLNSLLILAKLLSDNEEKTLTAQQVDYARTICSSGRDLLSLINEILDLSKVEAGKVEVKAQNVSIADLEDFCARSFDKVAEQKELFFKVDVKSDAPKQLNTDPLRLQQILKNLLSNAFKFTSTGGVTLEIGRPAPGTPFHSELLNSEDAVAFTVTDTGIGIPEDKQRIVFEAFHQADTSTSRTYGGTGLGLAISRELARLLGGEIALRSTPGRGSVFTLYLPSSPFVAVNAPVSLRREVHSDSSALTSLHGRKVLVVDDDVRNAYAIRNLLERRGMHVLLADNARASLDALQKHPDVDVVLMDIMMPEVDGYDATRNIRAMENFRKLPIIALTSKAMVGDREKVLEAGCTDFVPKPVDSDQLIAVMARLLATPRGSRDDHGRGPEGDAKSN